MDTKAVKKLLPGIVLALATIILIALAKSAWPVGPDYFFTFRPVTEAFVRGETRLYDEGSVGFYNAPWSIVLFLPTLLVSVKTGQFLLSVVSLLGVLVSVVVIADKSNKVLVALAIANLHTFDLIIRGNVDGFLALGIGLGWLGIKRKSPLMLGAGLWLLSIKPVNVILISLVFVKAVWRWSLRDKSMAVAPLLITTGVSFFVFGMDWPVRYVRAMTSHPPMVYLQTSLWRVLGLSQGLAWGIFLLLVLLFGVTVFTHKASTSNIKTALVLNIVFSPYTLGSHYVLLAPVFVVLAQESKALTAVWLLTLTPLLRLFWGFEAARIDIIYPVVLMIGLWVLLRKQTRVIALPGETVWGKLGKVRRKPIIYNAAAQGREDKKL